jgi:hypothetical protein
MLHVGVTALMVTTRLGIWPVWLTTLYPFQCQPSLYTISEMQLMFVFQENYVDVETTYMYLCMYMYSSISWINNKLVTNYWYTCASWFLNKWPLIFYSSLCPTWFAYWRTWSCLATPRSMTSTVSVIHSYRWGSEWVSEWVSIPEVVVPLEIMCLSRCFVVEDKHNTS